MQYINVFLLQLNLALVAGLLSALFCYVLYGSAFVKLVARLLNCRNDDDDDDSGGGGILQRVLVPVGIND